MQQMDEVKKIVLLMTIGLCDAIQSKVMPITEAEHFLFSPHTMRLMGDDAEVLDIIHRCTEFEDLARLVPSALEQAIADVKRQAEVLLRKMAPCDYQQDPWLDKLLS